MKDTTKGFTLIEIIVTLIVASIFGTLLISFMGTQVTNSVVPVVRVRQEYTLNQIMENINADYRKLLLESPDPLGTLRSSVNAGDYGTYTVVYNNFITFNGAGAEQVGGDRILKVSLSQGDHTLTTLFTK